jgi:hypothetical protein
MNEQRVGREASRDVVRQFRAERRRDPFRLCLHSGGAMTVQRVPKRFCSAQCWVAASSRKGIANAPRRKVN